MATNNANTQENGEWIHVGNGESNTVPGSKVVVPLSLNGPPICPNMTDAEFRKLVLGLRDEAVVIVRQRIAELVRWTPDIQARVVEWFGSSGSTIRTRLILGLEALVTVMSNLTGKNFVRPGSDADLAMGCLPNMKSLDGEVAWRKSNLNRPLAMQTASRGLFWLGNGAKNEMFYITSSGASALLVTDICM